MRYSKITHADLEKSVDISQPVFEFPITVYYEDTDAGGMVYHANYLRYFERCRSEWLIQIGIGLDIRIKLGIVIGILKTQ